MAVANKIEWDEIGKRLYETGVDHVVLYDFVEDKYTNGVAWNGVTSITENRSGAEPSPLYADNIKYIVLRSLEEYGLTVECYTYPPEFEKHNGMATLAKGAIIGQQARSAFGMSFRTLIGSDVDGDNHGYKLHLVYGCDATPSEESNATTSDSPEAKTFSFEISTTPIAVDGFRNTSCVTIDSTLADETKLQELEKKLYGDGESAPTLPFPNELKTLLDVGE